MKNPTEKEGILKEEEGAPKEEKEDIPQEN